MPLSHTSKFAALTDSQCTAIGRVVVEWSNVEYLLSVLLSRLLRTPEFLGRTYAQGLSAVRLQEAISEAVAIHRYRYGARIVSKAALTQIEAINAKVSALRAERNKLSHFCWCRTSDEEVFGTNFPGGIAGGKSHRRGNKVLRLSELKSLYASAHALTEELMQITSALPVVDERTA
jgi:hypothetical protein